MKQFVLFCCLFATFFSCLGQEKLEVYFDFNKFELNPTALTKLNDWIIQQPNNKVLKIHGFCDWKGTNEYNDTLSLKRVQTVFEYLTAHKIQMDANYISKGFGKNFTQDDNQALNRKVEIIFSNTISVTESEKKSDKTIEIKEFTLSEQVKVTKKGDKIKLKNINFFNNSSRIVPKSRNALLDLLNVMQENPKLIIEIQGHICCQPSNSMDHISTERAQTIYKYLIQNNIDNNRLTYKGYGVTQPLYPIPEKNTFEEEENRRVEIKIIEN
ncbi:OmpA family protein [Flavobacterium sp. SM2513]|uniref:OmpA family protein n=1 Tax=Flavobacterium sp. SM2513 TaxID=3424766 RepID=UPI003D7FE0B8